MGVDGATFLGIVLYFSCCAVPPGRFNKVIAGKFQPLALDGYTHVDGKEFAFVIVWPFAKKRMLIFNSMIFPFE